MDAISLEDRVTTRRKRSSIRTDSRTPSSEPSSPRMEGRKKKIGEKRRRFAGKSARVESKRLDWELAEEETLNVVIPDSLEKEWEPDLLEKVSPLLGDAGERWRPALEEIEQFDWTPAETKHHRTTSHTTAFISPTASNAIHSLLVPIGGEDLSTPTTPLTPDLWRYISISTQNKLGEGAFGKVYLAKDKMSGTCYAVKYVKQKPGSNLASEIRHLLSLNHENLVKIEGYAAEDQTFKLLLQYVDGGTIRSLYHQYCQGSLSEKLTGHLAKQLLAGIAYMHEHSICHRDLKGSNILVSRMGVAKIADFGLSRKVHSGDVSAGLTRYSSGTLPAIPTDAQSSMSMHKGSWLWMPPECFLKDEPRGLAMDIWSFGCILMECATGHVPWYPAQAETLLYKLKEGKVPLDLLEVSEDVCGDELEALMVNCLSWFASQRPTAKECMHYGFIVNAEILSSTNYVEEIKRVKRRNKRRA
jgi:hypothetical protein